MAAAGTHASTTRSKAARAVRRGGGKSRSCSRRRASGVPMAWLSVRAGVGERGGGLVRLR